MTCRFEKMKVCMTVSRHLFGGKDTKAISIKGVYLPLFHAKRLTEESS